MALSEKSISLNSLAISISFVQKRLQESQRKELMDISGYFDMQSSKLIYCIFFTTQLLIKFRDKPPKSLYFLFFYKYVSNAFVKSKKCFC